jgi:hypothetical protein
MMLPHTPAELEPVLTALDPAFTTPTFHRLATPPVAATPGRRTVANWRSQRLVGSGRAV